MTAAPPGIAGVFRRPFREQVAFFRGKLGTLVPTGTWRDMLREAHDRGFMVAGAQSADLLADLAAAVDAAIAEGESLETFRARFREIVARHGWTGWTGEGSAAGRAWRTRVIYRTNLATSYAAGRWAQLQAFPVWIYRHGGSLEPRPQHLAWDRMALPREHPFWRTHYPPNGWGCSCYVVGAGSPDAARIMGGDPDRRPPAGWDARDAKGRLPGVDEGWDYAPGATVEQAVRAAAAKMDAWPEPIAEAFLAAQPEPVQAAIRAERARVAKPPPPPLSYPPPPADPAAADRAFLAWVRRTQPGGVPATPILPHPGLTEPQTRAVVAYTGAAYQELNRALRRAGRPGRVPKTWRPMVDVLDRALEALPPAPGTVWRGGWLFGPSWDRVKRLREGQFVQFVAYTSTSRNPNHYRGTQEQFVNMRIAQASGRDVAPLSQHPYEQETLIPRGRVFVVRRKTIMPTGAVDLDLEEVRPDEVRGKVVRLSMEG